MNRRLFFKRRGGAAAGLSLALTAAACGGLLPSPPERPLFRLEAAGAVPSGLPRIPVGLSVDTATAPGGLDTRRIALTRSAVSLDYFADGEWTDRLPLMVQTALVEAFEKSAALAGVGPENLGAAADFVLETTIKEFEAIYDSEKTPPRVLVRFDVALLTLPDHKIIAQTSFSGEDKAVQNTLPDIVQAFDRALGQAIQKVVVWTVTTAASASHPRPANRRTALASP